MSLPQRCYIQDEHGNRLYYYFSPAELLSNFSPLLIILDANSKENAPHFAYKMWNVVTPLYLDSETQHQCSWTHDKETLLQELVMHLAQEYECEDHIYIYAKSSDTYGAISNGFAVAANAVYILEPYLLNTCYTSIKPLLMPFSDGVRPIFYLCKSDEVLHKGEDKNIINCFIETAKEKNIMIREEFCSELIQETDSHIKSVLKYLEKMSSQI